MRISSRFHLLASRVVDDGFRPARQVVASPSIAVGVMVLTESWPDSLWIQLLLTDY
jgi:hypothetical protein